MGKAKKRIKRKNEPGIIRTHFHSYYLQDFLFLLFFLFSCYYQPNDCNSCRCYQGYGQYVAARLVGRFRQFVYGRYCHAALGVAVQLLQILNADAGDDKLCAGLNFLAAVLGSYVKPREILVIGIGSFHAVGIEGKGSVALIGNQQGFACRNNQFIRILYRLPAISAVALMQYRSGEPYLNILAAGIGNDDVLRYFTILYVSLADKACSSCTAEIRFTREVLGKGPLYAYRGLFLRGALPVLHPGLL